LKQETFVKYNELNIYKQHLTSCIKQNRVVLPLERMVHTGWVYLVPVQHGRNTVEGCASVGL